MSNEPQSLDDIFNGVEAPEPTEPEPEPTADTEPEPEPARAEEPEPEKEPEPEPEAPAASENDDSESWTKAAVLDERRKRQALEAELEALRKPKEEQKPEEVPSIFEDESKYNDYVSKQIAKSVSDARLEMSAELMRMQDPDYDVKEAEFMDMAKDNPALVQEALKHPMPAKFAVDTVNKARELKKLDNIDEYKAKLRAEMEAELRKEFEAEMSDKQKQGEKTSSIKPSLANARSSSSAGEHVDKSLDELFGR